MLILLKRLQEIMQLYIQILWIFKYIVLINCEFIDNKSFPINFNEDSVDIMILYIKNG